MNKRKSLIILGNRWKPHQEIIDIFRSNNIFLMENFPTILFFPTQIPLPYPVFSVLALPAWWHNLSSGHRAWPLSLCSTDQQLLRSLSLGEMHHRWQDEAGVGGDGRMELALQKELLQLPEGNFFSNTGMYVHEIALFCLLGKLTTKN